MENEPILQFFKFAHLPEKMQAVSRPFCELASSIVETLPRNPERTVALRKLLEAKDAAVRAGIFVVLMIFLLPAVAFAQVAAPAAPSPFSALLEQFLSPSGIATAVFTLATVIFGFVQLEARRKNQIALGTYHAFHIVEDLAATTENTIDDKVAAGLKALDQYFAAQGWRALKPGETEAVKLGFSALNGASKLDEKVAEAARPANPPTP